MVESLSAEAREPSPAEIEITRRLLSEILVPARKKLGIDQAPLATALGIPRWHLSLIETGPMNSPDPFFPDKYFNALIEVWKDKGHQLEELAQKVTAATNHKHLEVKFP